MFFILTADGAMHINVNPPTDEIACFFGQNYGEGCRAIASSTLADHREELAILQATKPGPPNEDGTPGDLVSASNTITADMDTLTITAKDATGATLKTWQGVLAYPIPVVEPPAPPAPLPPVDLTDLDTRTKAIGLTIDVLARNIGILNGTRVTDDVARALLGELVHQEAIAHLPKIGDFTPPAVEEAAPVDAEPARPVL